jgi:hypothetical protein|tara:strand:+ start:334 stop:537 length:204 start_codon:yes stop_codon:yes gene_type:complete
MGKRFENPEGIVMMMTLKGMHQVHSHNVNGVHIFKTTDKQRALNHFKDMVMEMEVLHDSGNVNVSSS